MGKLAAGQAAYYLEQAGGRVSRAAAVGSGVEDYYAGGRESAGRWLGRGSVSLQLAGPVGGEALRAVLDGQTPDGRAALTGAAIKVPGFDVTFSAPKSVSLMFGLGAPTMRAAVLAAHAAAVSEAMRYFEYEVAVARRGRNGVRLVRGEGLVAAAFVHRTSRAGDPQLHTHVLVANAVRTADGRWSALDGRRVYQHARTAGFLYQVRLRAELTRRLGVEWTPVQRGLADVVGLPRPVLRAFSRRRVEVERELAAAGQASAAAAQTAVLESRRAKDRRLSAEQLEPEWRERAARLGVDDVELAALCGRAPVHRLIESIVTDIEDHVLGADGLTKHASTFTRADALRAVCERLPAGLDASLGELWRVVNRILVSDRVVSVLRPHGRLESDFRYTTVELLRLEQHILDFARAPSSPAGPVATSAACEGAIQARGHLSLEQSQMIRSLTCETARVAVVVGKAGTGKTSALDGARAAWEASGVPVVGAAVANRAARELADGAGIRSTSVASFLLSARRDRLPDGVVVVLDEASMIGTRQLAEVVLHVERAGGKLVLVGDDHQLPAVEAGGAFAALVQRGPTIRLTENRRQAAAWERDALDLLRSGAVDEALGVYGQHGRVTIGSDPERTRLGLVADWWRDGGPSSGVMIAFRRADVRDLNQRARALMRAAGRLGDVGIELDGREFAVGDQVVLRRNDRRIGVANGERGIVLSLDARRRTMRVAVGTRRVTLDARYLESGGRGNVAHGYAITGHVAQGLTTERAYVLGSESAYREWGYVAMSRGRQLNRYYVVGRGSLERDEFAPTERPEDPLAAVRAALARSRAQRLASERETRSLE